MLKHLRTHMRWIMIAIVGAFLLSTFLMYSDGRRGGGGPSPDNSGGDYVVAVVNGHEIMRSSLENMVRNYVQQANIREITSVDVPFLYKAALDNAIFQTELEKEVGARNILVSDTEITASVNEMSDRFPTREAFYQYLERSGIKMEALRDDIKRQISTNKTIEIAISNQPISEDSVVEFYDMTKSIFFTQPSGFMFDIAQVISAQTASKLRELLKDDGSNWELVLSDDIPSADIIRKTDAPAFMSEAFLSADEKMHPLLTAEVGKVAPIIEVSSNDFMVAIKHEAVEGKTVPFDEASGDIRAMLQEQQSRGAFDDFSRSLVSRANVEILDKALFPAPGSEDVRQSN